MSVLLSLFSVLVLVLIVFLGIDKLGLYTLFGIIIPYAAIATFLAGIIYRVISWAKSPVPFRIPTTSGQGKSLPWIKYNKFDNPNNIFGVLVRMALEVFLFRSLLKNNKLERTDGPGGPTLSYGGFSWLWLAGLAFHYCFLMIVVRHLRFFTEPVMFFIPWIEGMDGLMRIGIPTLYISNIIILAAVTFLFIRRVFVPQLRYISLPADYFPVFLILGIAITGILIRHFFKVDLLQVKQLALGLSTFNPVAVKGVGVSFYIHLFLVSTLLFYFPFSKLMHMFGVFMSPTRNLAANNRAKRHVNPNSQPVKVHTYEEYEDEFRDLMKSVGLPVEKE